MFTFFRKLFRIKKTKVSLIIVFAIGLFVACWYWVPYVIAAFAILWEFLGQSISAKSYKYYYTIGETVNCEILYHVSQPNRYIYVEIVDDVSGVVQASDIIYPLITYGYHTVYFDEYVATYPGYFKCHAEIRSEGGKPMGWQGSTFYFIVGETGPTYPNRLKLWCGDNIKGNPGERLFPTDKTAHYIAVQVEGTDHTAPVHFRSDKCTFEWSGVTSIIKEQEPITINGQIIYLAKTWVKLPAEQPPPGQCLPYIVVASQDESPNEVTFTIYNIRDGEKSHNIGSYTHQKNTFGEVPGDNYISVLDNQGHPVIDPGMASDYKDIMIELDWYKWESSVDTTTIKAIAQLIKQILHTAGIDTLNSIFIGNEITNMPDSTTRAQRMGLLAEHKASLTGHQRIWLNKIHVILGSKEWDLSLQDVFGIVEEHSTVEGGATLEDWLLYTMHRGSGSTDFTKASLDSTGCFIFAKQIVDYLEPLYPRPSDIQAIALATAHEIGHALGMWHYDAVQAGTNVMVRNFYDAYRSGTGFNDYGKFSHKTLNGDYDINGYIWDGLNTRHVIGINTVNVME